MDAESSARSLNTGIQEMGMKTVELRGTTEDLTQTVPKKSAHVAGLLDAEMWHSRTVVSSALLANEV